MLREVSERVRDVRGRGFSTQYSINGRPGNGDVRGGVEGVAGVLVLKLVVLFWSRGRRQWPKIFRIMDKRVGGRKKCCGTYVLLMVIDNFETLKPFSVLITVVNYA